MMTADALAPVSPAELAAGLTTSGLGGQALRAMLLDLKRMVPPEQIPL
jgi:hypothetical protein